MHSLMFILRIHLFRVYNSQHESDIIRLEAVETERRSRLAIMNYFVFLKEQQKRKKLKKQAQVQKNIEITFMSAWFVMGVFLVSLIIYSMQS